MPDYLTPTRARQLLQKHGLTTKRSLGQHFLVDPNTVRRIVRLAHVGQGERIVEVGPGLGSLTVGLVEAGAHVVAVELDERVAGALREVVGDEAAVDVVVADAMSADLHGLAEDGARLISNLPYNVATPIMARVLDEAPNISGGVVMVQREVGERWCAPPGSKAYGSISVKFAYHSIARIIGDVPRTVFMPQPKVSSALVAFERRIEPPVDVGSPEGFFRFVEDAFTYRRKTLRNALASAGRPVDAAEAAFTRCGVDPAIRPEQLPLEVWACVYRATEAPA